MIVETLLLISQRLSKHINIPQIIIFHDLIALIAHITQRNTTVDEFKLFVPHDVKSTLIEDPIYQFSQVRVIYVYCNNSNDVKDPVKQTPKVQGKFRFIHERSLRTYIRNVAGAAKDSQDQASSMDTKRIAKKRLNGNADHLPAPKRNATGSSYGYNVGNIGDFAQHYTCAICTFLLRQPYQLACSDRVCANCIEMKPHEMQCNNCGEVASKSEAWFDRGAFNYLNESLVKCYSRQWTDRLQFYQQHIDEYRQGSVRGGSAACGIEESRLQSRNLSTNSSLTMNNIAISDYRPVPYNGAESQLQQSHYLSLGDQNDLFVNSDGMITWRIPGFQAKFHDAQTQRQKSIYSPTFITPSGYNMRVILYPHGDADVRGTHMSIFAVLLRGDHDDRLIWPLTCRLTFVLVDQTNMNGIEQHVSKQIWSDFHSKCFERPDTMMNQGYGIKKFVDLEFIHQYKNLYIKDDTIYIQVTVDSSSSRPEMVPRNDIGDTPNDDNYVDTIFEDIEKYVRVAGSELNRNRNNQKIVMASPHHEMVHNTQCVQLKELNLDT
ncbi:unnamed protein product [Adineta ricciae]|uniref:MATH domain-containing protein n=1 Tax=Adineta ricciae TaxID=249248 RepID=A0A814HB14_ADIRI|nr:unnamed protein product [Adineta ricciae]